MNTGTALEKFEAAVGAQMAPVGGSGDMEAAGRALLGAVRPAVRQLVLDLAEEAAAEVDEQLPYNRVEVVLRGGEPALRVRPDEEWGREFVGEDYEARISLRLPPSLKSAVEEAARSAEDSVNSYLVKTLATAAAGSGRRVGQRVKGTVRT